MLLTIVVSILLLAIFLLANTLYVKGRSYGELSLSEIGSPLRTALIPGIAIGIAVMFVMTRFFPVKEIGHVFAPNYGMDLIYKARIKSGNGKEHIGDAYVYYDPSPGEDDCPIEVERLKFNGRTYEVESNEGYCLYDIGRWGEIGFAGHSGVEVLLLDEKVGEH